MGMLGLRVSCHAQLHSGCSSMIAVALLVPKARVEAAEVPCRVVRAFMSGGQSRLATFLWHLAQSVRQTLRSHGAWRFAVYHVHGLCAETRWAPLFGVWVNDRRSECRRVS